MARIKKAQAGTRASADSTEYYRRKYLDKVGDLMFVTRPKAKKAYENDMEQALNDMKRQRLKGKPGYDKDGFPVKKQRNGGKTSIKKAQDGKKVRLKEDSRDYITKIKTDDKGDITSLKSRRTLKGLLTGAPRSKKIMKSGGKVVKKSTSKSKKK